MVRRNGQTLQCTAQMGVSIVLKEIWKKPRPFLNVFLQLGFYTALV